MIKILDIQLETEYSWDDIKSTGSWLEVRNGASNWRQYKQTTLVSRQVSIKVDLIETNWAGVASLYPTWQGVKDNVSTWQELRDF